MTAITTAPKPEDEVDKNNTRKDNFWSQTVKQNNARLDGKNIPADVLSELKFIEAALLANGKRSG